MIGVSGGELQHVGGGVERESLMAHRRGQEGQIGRRIVEEGGQRPGGKVILHGRADLHRFAALQDLQRRNHSEKNANKEITHLFDRAEIEIIGLMNDRLGHEIGCGGGGEHHQRRDGKHPKQGRFLNILGQQHRAQHHAEPQQVRRATEQPVLVRSFFLPHCLRSTAEIPCIEHPEHDQQQTHRQRPGLPAVLDHPPERHAAQEAQEQRRIADGREAAADIADHKDEEYDVEAGDAVLVHFDPWTDQQHRRSRSADEVRQHRTD